MKHTVASDHRLLPGFSSDSILFGRKLLAKVTDNLPAEDRLLGLLITQHHFWVSGKSPGYGDTLFFAAG